MFIYVCVQFLVIIRLCQCVFVLLYSVFIVIIRRIQWLYDYGGVVVVGSGDRREGKGKYEKQEKKDEYEDAKDDEEEDKA